MFLFVSFCFIISIVHSSVSNQVNNNAVVTLNNNNYKQFLAENEYVFAKFYAPWCIHSIRMKSEFINAAEEGSKLNLPVKFVEINCDVETELCDEYEATRFPTLLLLRRNAKLKYGLKRTSEDFINWLKKQIRPAPIQLNTTEDAEEFLNTTDVTIIGFFKNKSSSMARNFLSIVDNLAYPTFASTSNEEIFKKFNVEPSSIVLFRKDNGNKVVFKGNLTLNELNYFVNAEASPLIIHSNESIVSELLALKDKDLLVAFISFSSNLQSFVDLAKPIAEEFQSVLQFIAFDVDDTAYEPGNIVFFTIQGNKYQMEEPLTSENLLKLTKLAKLIKLIILLYVLIKENVTFVYNCAI